MLQPILLMLLCGGHNRSYQAFVRVAYQVIPYHPWNICFTFSYCFCHGFVSLGIYSFTSNEAATISLAFLNESIWPAAIACIMILPLAVASIGPVTTFRPSASAVN